MVRQEIKKVAIGMSGGVDSSVTASLLQEQGYEVCGLTIKVHDNSGKAVEDAEKVCEKLGIEFYSLDLTKVFKETVIKHFLDSYSKGITPNPCVRCNKLIKWGAMYEYANKELGCNYIATGHYANIEFTNNEYKLKRAKDRSKDQTYMLVNLTQDDLSHTLFPLADFEKDETRASARKAELPSAETAESQDVCFVPLGVKTQEYLHEHFGEQPGKIIDCSNDKILGEHSGIYKFTIGQRKGIKIAYPYPLYVVSLDVKNNIVYVGGKEDTQSNNLIASDVNWISGKNPSEEFFALSKIRYNSPAKLAKVIPVDSSTVSVEFEESQNAITTGQTVAFYTLDNQYLLGGGIIQ